MEQAQKQPNIAFKPELGKMTRNLSTVISSMGFNKELRQLFFPLISKNKGIVFRQNVSRAEADSDLINTYELDTKLERAGANTEIDLDSIPF